MAKTGTDDAENRLTQVDGGATATYVYDVNGVRVRKAAGSAWWEYFYGVDGNVDGEMNQDGWLVYYVYLGDRLIVQYRDDTTYFFQSDHLGSTRLLTGLTGSVCESIDYLPFGEYASLTGTCSTTHQFTGKERDSESGLDNFGARYDSSQYGRFMSPDPSNLSVDFWLPQTWNRYSYALNNPLTVVDRNGLWPWYIHEEIIDSSFPGLSKQDLQTLKDASWNMDYGPGQQSGSLSFEHGMSDGLNGQTPSEAEQQANAFIAQNEHDAQKIQADWIAQGHSGIAPAALTAFGNALHTITDRLSPAHIGYQPWYGQPWWYPSAIAHWLHESYITPFQMGLATSAAQQAFAQTFGVFGYDEFDLMQLQNQQQEQVTSQIGLSPGSGCYQDENGNVTCP